MKKLFWRGVEAALYAGGWLLVNTMRVLDEMSEAAGDLVGDVGKGIGDLFRRRK